MSSWIDANWQAPAGIRAGTTTRQGGVSAGAYASFNLAEHVKDDPYAVEKNRQSLKQQHNLSHPPVWLNQIHSDRVVDIDKSDQFVDADASISKSARAVCVVMTADCLPVLFCDNQGQSIAAAHAGWRGLASGVLINTVRAFEQPSSDLMAWMGPAIGPQAFEVGDDVYDAFTRLSSDYKAAFIATDKGKWHMDIYKAARLQLESLGLGNISGGEYCTYTQDELFYSYRREATTGRMASLIWRDYE